MADQVFASLNPDDAVQGGLLSDITVEIIKSRFALWDYAGTLPDPALAIHWEGKDTTTGEDLDINYWAFGKEAAKDWTPSEDGRHLVSVSSTPTLKKGSNGILLMESLINSGWPKDRLGGDASVFEGAVVHLARVPAPNRAGLEKRPRADGKDYGPPTILLVDRIDKFPWEKSKPGAGASAAGKPGPAAGSKPPGAPAGKPSSKPAAATAASSTVDQSDVLALAVEVLLGIVSEKGPTPLKHIPMMVFQRLNADPDPARKALCQRVVATISPPAFYDQVEMLVIVDGVLQFAG
jgi:hypothetical protein